MTGRLIRNLVKGQFYINNFVLHENEVKKVIRINDKTVVFGTDENFYRVSKNEVDGCIVKYAVHVGKKIFDVSYSDYELANESVDIVEGYTVLVKTRARIGSTVRINCLETVDRYNLIDSNSRFGTIVDQDAAFFMIDMNNSKQPLKLHRTRFVLVNEKDSKIFFKIICPKCNR